MAINIILVDDHTMFLEGLEATLSKQAHLNVTNVLTNARDALAVLNTQTPDLLITDISMPDINGIEFIQAVNQKHPTLKILVISMFQQIQAFQGIKGYVLKETGTEELLLAIDKIAIQNETYFYNAYQKPEQSLKFNSTILTQREKDIVNLIAKEHTTSEIADQLFLSKYTVETHKKNIYLKLKVTNAAGLVKKAVYLGYIH
jgi:DNA-binding NarL/FixJ family response regulator